MKKTRRVYAIDGVTMEITLVRNDAPPKIVVDVVSIDGKDPSKAKTAYQGFAEALGDIWPPFSDGEPRLREDY